VTYSIVACDLEGGQWGVAVQSKFPAVGSVVPWAEPDAGASASNDFSVSSRYRSIRSSASSISIPRFSAMLTNASR